MNHEIYMQRCIQLAQRGLGYAAPNPQVGSVVVYNNKIIGEGYHQRYGEGHAEVNAIASVEDKSLLEKSTIYVTLEPCFHYGKTPPCVELILKHRIPHVVIASTDPYEKVAGQSIQKLRAAGVKVEEGILKEEAVWLNRRFFTTIQKKRPYIILKYAQSIDGFIGQEGKTLPISNALCKRLVHQWRSQEASIMVGTNTAATDNPQLDVRHYFGKNPLRLVIDRDLRLPNDLKLFDQTIPTWVFTAQESSTQNTENLQYIQVPFGDQLLPSILEHLQQQKIQSLFVEGGKQLLQSFIDQGLWDEARVLIGNKHLNKGVEAPKLKNHHLLKEEKVADDRYRLYTNNA
ncbi:MAG: bifunctional diaminohydroxyphosphoribosylaminopyrimidine deaminase/5-amino-6-(5-phosphoribosylamino)uracil reductase RibD [Aureispira sp.]|nr:bifunctional diaminohydroxyphosphoribosylaminopyrimidine deaminase/5-amino-6-(5-phosphoribosylamino)uracil reductase RibD [Aureispira sp.]